MENRKELLACGISEVHPEFFDQVSNPGHNSLWLSVSPNGFLVLLTEYSFLFNERLFQVE